MKNDACMKTKPGRACNPTRNGCGNDPANCKYGVSHLSDHQIAMRVATIISASSPDELATEFPVPPGWGCNHVPAVPAVKDGEYLRALHRFCFLMGQRFGEKEALGWEGWDDPAYHDGMVAVAMEKLRALARGSSDDPAKDAADVANFALFFWHHARPRGGEG